MLANEKQVGGDHYDKKGEQHWDRIYRLYGRGYFIGCATKYLERYHLKNGKEDLEKAVHFIEKLKELEYGEIKKMSPETQKLFNQEARRIMAGDKVGDIRNHQNPYANIKDPA